MKMAMLELDGLITHEIGLGEINQAIQIVKSGEAGRVLIAMKCAVGVGKREE